MEHLPVEYGGERVGEAVAEREKLYTSLKVRTALRPGLWYAWAVGERGELRVGVLEPVDGYGVIERRFSRQALEPVGTLLRVEARPAGDGEPAWKRAAQGQRLLRSVRFQRQLRNVRDALTRTDNGFRRVALVREDNAPFPIPELFCLASPTRIGTRDYWVFSFDRQGWPSL